MRRQWCTIFIRVPFWNHRFGQESSNMFMWDFFFKVECFDFHSHFLLQWIEFACQSNAHNLKDLMSTNLNSSTVLGKTCSVFMLFVPSQTHSKDVSPIFERQHYTRKSCTLWPQTWRKRFPTKAETMIAALWLQYILHFCLDIIL